MSHSAISATATMAFDLELDIDNNKTIIDFDTAISSLKVIYDRIEFIDTGFSFTEFMRIGVDKDMEDIKHLAFKNMDTQNDLHIAFQFAEGANTATIKIRPLGFFILWNRNIQLTDNAAMPVNASGTITNIWGYFENHNGRIRIVGLNN